MRQILEVIAVDEGMVRRRYWSLLRQDVLEVLAAFVPVVHWGVLSWFVARARPLLPIFWADELWGSALILQLRSLLGLLFLFGIFFTCCRVQVENL